MIKKNITYVSRIGAITTYEGETIEMKMERIVSNNEPIHDGAPLIYMERGEGINQGYDVRTDRFDVAVEAMDKVTKSKVAKREQRHKKPEEKPEGQSIQGTEPPKTPAA